MRLREVLPYVFYAASLLVMLWDVFLAGQIGQLRRAPRFFRSVTALAGLLIAPAVLVAVAAASILNGRAIHIIAWVWPLTPERHSRLRIRLERRASRSGDRSYGRQPSA